MVRHVAAMGVDNTNVVGMNYTALAPDVETIEWKSGVGEIEYSDRARLRENFVDVTPYCPFFQQFMTLLVGITLTQAQKIQTDLIDVLYDSKRQMPYHYVVAAGDFMWEATDPTIAAMSIEVLPTIIGYSTGTSDATPVGKINALIDQINAWLVNPGNTLTTQIESNIVDGVNSIVADGTNSAVVNVHNNFISFFNGTILVTISGNLQTSGLSTVPPNYAAPGLSGNLPSSGDTMGPIGHISGVTQNPFPTFPHQGITPDPSIPPINWTPLGMASTVTLSATEMGTLMNGIAQRRASLLNVCTTKKAAVNALTTLAAVIAYDVTAGWPAV
jgi:hypothetical protein